MEDDSAMIVNFLLKDRKVLIENAKNKEHDIVVEVDGIFIQNIDFVKIQTPWFKKTVNELKTILKRLSTVSNKNNFIQILAVISKLEELKDSNIKLNTSKWYSNTLMEAEYDMLRTCRDILSSPVKEAKDATENVICKLLLI